jgi:hypothetical protein
MAFLALFAVLPPLNAARVATRSTQHGQIRKPSPGATLISTARVCQLTGEQDRAVQPPQPTLNQTATRWGLQGTDDGFSFTYHGQTWFLFGDSVPTPTFRRSDNRANVPLRGIGDNDSIATSQAPAGTDCPVLQFIPNLIGAFTRPTVVTQPRDRPVTLRTNETPQAGISDGDQMYVIFGTDNFASNPAGQPAHPNGGPTRTVMTSAIDDAQTLQFRYLYDLSSGPDGKFTFVATGPDGRYTDIWGTQAAETEYRHSSVYFARKPTNGLSEPAGMQYFRGTDSHGRPLFGASESSAVPLFHDVPRDCAGEISTQWNLYLKRWVLLYNCADNTVSNRRGIYMRMSTHPWGPWSAPATVFANRDGLCQFIHRAPAPDRPPCDALSAPDREQVQGGAYAPGIINDLTKGGVTKLGRWSTIYYTMSTWNPYQVVVMQSTVREGGQ